MKFKTDYILSCLKNKDRFKNVTPKYGDWYGNVSTKRVLVVTSPKDITYGTPESFYVPDLNDLFQLMDNQVCAIQEKEKPEMKVTFSTDSESPWKLDLELPSGSITMISKAGSPHEALLQGLIQLCGLLVYDAEGKRVDPFEGM
jgi:hypothetical protein